MKINKKTRVLLYVLLFVALLVTTVSMVLTATAATTEFAGGSGTAADPYLIETKEQLNNVRNHLDAHYKMVADIVFTDADFAESGTFYNEGAGWEPIGKTPTYAFCGVFNGNKFSIKGLYSNWDNTYIGLFGCNKGTIIELKMSDARISVIRDSAYVGNIVGWNNGHIEKCISYSDISGKSNQIYTEIFVGGIAGTNYGSITYCANDGNISVTATKSSTDAFAGGITGYNHNNEISLCNNSGTIISSGQTRYAYAGGIVGQNYSGSIISCFNKGDVTANGSYSSAGGITTKTYGDITNCYNFGEICAMGSSTDKQDVAGGIASDNYGTISGCYNRGNVSGIFAGGVLGRNEETHIVTNCYNTAEVSTCRGSFSYLGGIVGDNDGIVKLNYNVGKINTGFYSAGIVGENGTDGEVNACYYLDACALKGISTGVGETYSCNGLQLEQSSTFIGFDFLTIWEFKENNLYSYPTLINNPYFEEKTTGDSEVSSRDKVINTAIEGTILKSDIMLSGETVIIIPTNKNAVAMTESELSDILNDSSITITSSNGVIGTGSKITIGEYEVSLVVKGDIDGDGIATVFDGIIIKKAIANNGFNNEGLREFAGDVDGANGTTAEDVSALIAHIVGRDYIE